MSYHLFRNNFKLFNRKIKIWKRLIVDEAHLLKNCGTGIQKVLATIRVEHSVILATGILI